MILLTPLRNLQNTTKCNTQRILIHNPVKSTKNYILYITHRHLIMWDTHIWCIHTYTQTTGNCTLLSSYNMTHECLSKMYEHTCTLFIICVTKQAICHASSYLTHSSIFFISPIAKCTHCTISNTLRTKKFLIITTRRITAKDPVTFLQNPHTTSFLQTFSRFCFNTQTPHCMQVWNQRVSC